MIMGSAVSVEAAPDRRGDDDDGCPGGRGIRSQADGIFGVSGCELRPFPAGGTPGDTEAVNTRFRQVSQPSAPRAVQTRPPRPTGPLDRACCCVARAVVRVVMPPTPGRPHETELLLCGHHYRVSRDAFAAARARVEELPRAAADATAWFHDDRARTYAMVVKG